MGKSSRPQTDYKAAKPTVASRRIIETGWFSCGNKFSNAPLGR
jgi:hypothetical protein